LSILEAPSADRDRVAAADTHHGPPGVTMSEADLLDEYVQRTVAGDRIAFQALYDVLSPYVRDSAACLFGHGDKADSVTNAVFNDVWHLARQYQPGGEGVRTWVLNVAGQHTMNRYKPDTSHGTGGDDRG
jgi:RNA polymerase sigma-70 factor, ECF subfamily